MKKDWRSPELQILDVSETFNNGKGNGLTNPDNPNYGDIPGCKPSGGKPQKCDS